MGCVKSLQNHTPAGRGTENIIKLVDFMRGIAMSRTFWAVWAACAALSGAAMAETTPTFSKDVAPILYKNCASCHRPGDIAPMSLLTYEQARPWAKSIREKVSLGLMPPWHATQPRGTFLERPAAERCRQRDADPLGRARARRRATPRICRRCRSSPKAGRSARPTWCSPWRSRTKCRRHGHHRVSVLQDPHEFHGRQMGAGDRSAARRAQRGASHSGVLPGAGRAAALAGVTCRFCRGRSMLAQTGQFRAAAAARQGPGTLIATTAPGTNAMVFAPGTAMRDQGRRDADAASPLHRQRQGRHRP